MDKIDSTGHGICAACGNNELIVIQSGGKNICHYCAQRPFTHIFEKLKRCKHCGAALDKNETEVSHYRDCIGRQRRCFNTNLYK